MEVHRVVLDDGEAVLRAAAADRHAAAREVDVLVGEGELDVVHVHAAEGGEAEAGAADADEQLVPAERRGALGEDRAGRGGGALRHATDEAERLTAARRTDRDAADARAERVADQRD